MTKKESNNGKQIRWGKPKFTKIYKKNIFPKYDKYYSHGMIHINNVIDNMMILTDYYNLDNKMAYVIASYHDLGLNVNRENHEYESMSQCL